MYNIKPLSKETIKFTKEILKNLNEDGTCSLYECDKCGLGYENSVNGFTNCDNCNLTYKLKNILKHYKEVTNEKM